jgi:hypothetical protein
VCLRNFYGQQEHCWSLEKKKMTVSETGKAELHDLLCSGCAVTPASPEMLQHADAIVCKV